MKLNNRFLLWCAFSFLAFPVSAHAGQGLFLRINTYFDDASIRLDSIECVANEKELMNGDLALNRKVYLEAKATLLSKCVYTPSVVKFSIYQGQTKLQSYELLISSGGSKITPEYERSVNESLRSITTLYPHFGNGSQDFVTIAFAPKSSDRWQEQSASTIADKPINQVLMPGTHDTGTYGIDGNSFITPDAPSEYISLLKNYAMGWSKTQEFNVASQLNFGIRYFDLRLCGRKYSGEETEVVTCHAFSGAKFNDVIDQISAFLTQPEHSKEIVILDMNHLYGLSDAQIKSVNDYLLNKFGDKIASPSDFTPQSSYSAFWNANKQVILSIDSSNQNLNSNVYWGQSTISSPWPNANKTDALLNAMAANLNNRDFTKFFVLQSQKTQQTSDIINGKTPGTYPTSIKEFTGKDKDDVHLWMQRNKSLLQEKGNIIIEDFSNGVDLLQLGN